MALRSARDGRLLRLGDVVALRAGRRGRARRALDGLDTPVRLVLDDVHELTGREVLRDLARLVRRRPAGLRLVLASRTDPPISVPRLRLEGRLHEVRADALRFTPDDTAALLAASGLDLTPPQLAVLHARTEGWAAGLRLAALALRATDDVDALPHRLLRGRALGRRLPDRRDPRRAEPATRRTSCAW